MSRYQPAHSPLAGRMPLPGGGQPQHLAPYPQQGPATPGAGGPRPSPRGRPQPQSKVMKQIEMDNLEPNYLIPPSPHSRLLLALQSPFRDEIAWSLSRLIFASSLHPDHLILSEWCGLTERLLSFVQRFSNAARGVSGWEWDEEDAVPFGDETDDSEDEAESSALALRNKSSSAQFDPRKNAEHFFILNAAASASLILRNACVIPANSHWLTKQQDIMQIVHEVISLPEYLFGFEVSVDVDTYKTRTFEDEEEGRLEGIREIRADWMEILKDLAPRMKLHERSRVMRLADGSVRQSPPSTPMPGTDEPIASRSHSSDQIYEHCLIILHTTSDRGLLLPVIRFLAQLISNAKAKQDIFAERVVISRDGKRGASPGILARVKDLLPLVEADQALGEAVLDCLDASVETAVEVGPKGESGEIDVEEVKTIYPNALRLFDFTEEQQKHSVVSLLTRYLTLNIESWDREHRLTLHPAIHDYYAIPTKMRYQKESSNIEPALTQHRNNWLRLRSMKAEDGLCGYITEREKKELKTLSEPERLKEWLKLVIKPAGRSQDPVNPNYITQMQIWTSYRDTFTPLIKEAQRRQQAALPPLMSAFDVIAKVTDVFPSAAAVLIPEEDTRVGGQKFVIRGLEANLRPELYRYQCKWKGCPAPKTDSLTAQTEHLRVHIQHADDLGKCRWLNCTHREEVSEGGDEGRVRSRLLEHARTHLPGHPPKGEDAGSISAAPAAKLKAPLPDLTQLLPSGRTMPITKRQAPTEEPTVTEGTEQEKKRNPHAISATTPSRFTMDRTSSIHYKVYRTPCDRTTFVGEGPAHSSARILRRIAQMCHAVLGEDDGSVEEEDEEGARGEVAESAGGPKRVKLDFSDRSEDVKFGMPFTLPKNFQSTVAPAAASAFGSMPIVLGPDGALSVSLGENGRAVSQAAAAGEETEGSQLKVLATRALGDLVSVEDVLLQWAGWNDILTRELSETMSYVAATKGGTEGRSGLWKRARQSDEGGGEEVEEM